MVLGLRSKSKQITSIQVEYTVEVLEIKPWPSSQSLKSIHSVVLQWENGDRKFGLTNPVTPSLSEEKIEINEIFRLQVTLMKENSRRSNVGGSFHKNILQFNLHEHKKDKAVKGQLGMAVLDLSQHGIIEDSLRVGIPLTFKRTLRNAGQPILYVNLRSFEKSGPESSSSESLSKEVSTDGDGKGSVLALMSEEYAEEDEIASFTDEDDATSYSSPTNSYSFVENNVVLWPQRSPEEKYHSKNVSETILKEDSEEGQAKQESLNVSETALKGDSEEGQEKQESLNVSETALKGDSEEGQVKQEPLLHDACLEQIDRSAQSSPIGLSIHRVSSKNDDLDFSRTHKVCSEAPLDISGTETLPLSFHHEEEVLENNFRSTTNETTFRNYKEENDAENGAEHAEEDQIRNSYSSGAIAQNEESNGSLSHVTQRSVSFSVRSPPHIVQGNGNTNENQCLKNLNEIGILEDVSNGVRHVSDRRANDTMKNSCSFHRRFSAKKVHELECRVELLEGELREAAAMEMALYSVVAEHGSSMHKVHTPARRLSRLYLYASNIFSGERRAGAARSVVSGLVIVVKACGNDVPRLTFWLSNLVVLRAIVSHAIGQSEEPNSSAHFMENVGTGTTKGKNFPLKWESIPLRNENSSSSEEFNNWDNPQTFAAALEKVEAWIFARIVESVWWQTLTPYMQSSKEGSESKSFSRWKKIFKRESSLGKKTQTSCSFEIWKIAFQDACEMLCPVRGEGHECGCLPMLAKQIMEQCVARLDVAMFNALLRESDDESSTDPVADPIINHMVLPFPPGKSSFGAGAQLKNAVGPVIGKKINLSRSLTIGNWSRSLTDLFGIDEDSSPDKKDVDDERANVSVSLKSFHLLNALSDILMLPKHMLLERKVRKEVCPAFSSSVVGRILSGFFPDEFCPDQVPESVFEALDSEDQIMPNDDGMIRNLPCNASPVSYFPPSVSSIQKIIGDVQRTSLMKRNRSSVIRKCHASDDELEELDSPFSAVIFDESPSPSVKAKAKTHINSCRYQLLRGVWKFDD